MYVRIGYLEILDSYISSISVGDIVTVEALIKNPLDWHHFYENLNSIKSGDTTHFTVVTDGGERVVGMGNITEIDKWSNNGQYGFKIKLRTSKQKSVSMKRFPLRSSIDFKTKNLERKLEVTAT
ncbi:MAG: hypothetical protein WBP64_18810 [Nitrososphaeraceae archaeon]|jgi:hypothetical protein